MFWPVHRGTNIEEGKELLKLMGNVGMGTVPTFMLKVILFHNWSVHFWAVKASSKTQQNQRKGFYWAEQRGCGRASWNETSRLLSRWTGVGF